MLVFFFKGTSSLYAGKIEGRVSYSSQEKSSAVMLSPYAGNTYRANRETIVKLVY
ncbi:hypothetical protein ACFL6E_02665 [Candidatus Neomarinimicrobiota bacterium]